MTTSLTPVRDAVASERLASQYYAVRSRSIKLQEPLSAEDCTTQSMPDASPTKWHLAHTSWFFETLVVQPELPDYRPFKDAFSVFFNSYYNSLGQQHPRPKRGLLTRPSLADVLAYRAHVDAHMKRVFERGELSKERASIIEVGINHEQQHQELILTDVKHLLSCNPLHPVYREGAGSRSGVTAPDPAWRAFSGGVEEIGYDGAGFAYDNETPRHRVFLEAFEIASRPVTAGEYLEFMRDGGYANPLLWLSDGWTAVQTNGWHAPLYWEEHDGEWHLFTLGGMRPVDPHEPVCHISYFEADAYARWAGARLPSEAEWEIATADAARAGNFMESERYHPAAPAGQADAPLQQVFGDAWEWTKSAYEPYPGYRAPEGPLGEYNSKFMCSQLVLRGGSCATPESHIRPTYRNFFPPDARWQFSGVRLARD